MSGGIPLAGRHPSVVLQCPQYFPQDGDRGETSGTVGDIGEFQLSKKFEQGRLVQSHRGVCPFSELL